MAGRNLRLLLLSLTVAWLAAGGCATMTNDTTVCPEYRDLRCATAPECSMDKQRGCRLCSCTAARSTGGEMPSPVQPDIRPPDRN